MDIWAMQIKNSITSSANPLLLQRKSIPEKPISIPRSFRKMGSFRVENGRFFEIRVSKVYNSSRSQYHYLYQCQYQSLVVRAMGNNNSEDSKSDSSSSPDNGDSSIQEGNGPQANNSSSETNMLNDMGSQKLHQKTLDWREFRASLYIKEQVEAVDPDTHKKEAASMESKHLDLKWAHPISSPETGCVLIAKEKLDGVHTFERTVVLILRSGTRHPQEGPFGVVINRPLHKKIKHMKPTNPDLETTFAHCSLHFGGPLEASMFLLRAWEKYQLPRFEEVIPGLCFGARNSLDEAVGLVKKGVLKPHDFRFFVGYAGWQLDQLREEIESDYWYVAACSANVIFGPSSSSSECLWEEILLLMGGHYSELRRKPKQDM